MEVTQQRVSMYYGPHTWSETALAFWSPVDYIIIPKWLTWVCGVCSLFCSILNFRSCLAMY